MAWLENTLRKFEELGFFGTFMKFLATFNFLLSILLALLLYQLIPGEREIMAASFYVTWGQMWLSISLSLSAIKQDKSWTHIVAGPFYLLWVLSPQGKVVVLSGIITVACQFMSYYQPGINRIWYILETVAFFSSVVFVKSACEIVLKMKTALPEGDLNVEPSILVLSPTLGMVAFARYLQILMHRMVKMASEKEYAKNHKEVL